MMQAAGRKGNEVGITAQLPSLALVMQREQNCELAVRFSPGRRIVETESPVKMESGRGNAAPPRRGSPEGGSPSESGAGLPVAAHKAGGCLLSRVRERCFDLGHGQGCPPAMAGQDASGTIRQKSRIVRRRLRARGTSHPARCIARSHAQRRMTLPPADSRFVSSYLGGASSPTTKLRLSQIR